jgi:hypothetical protein
MNAVPRIATVVGVTAGVIAGAILPASAAFGDAVPVATTMGTLTVAAPASVTVTDSCATTTTVVKRTVYTNPTTGVQTQTAYSSTSSTVSSTTNVNSFTSSTASGPRFNETTTTETTKNTMLSVTASWTASGTRGVNGYLVNAHLVDGSVYPMAQTAAGTLSTSAVVDADYLSYQPRLSVTTLTAYAWTATTAQTPVLTC